MTSYEVYAQNLIIEYQNWPQDVQEDEYKTADKLNEFIRKLTGEEIPVSTEEIFDLLRFLTTESVSRIGEIFANAGISKKKMD